MASACAANLLMPMDTFNYWILFVRKADCRCRPYQHALPGEWGLPDMLGRFIPGSKYASNWRSTKVRYLRWRLKDETEISLCRLPRIRVNRIYNKVASFLAAVLHSDWLRLPVDVSDTTVASSGKWSTSVSHCSLAFTTSKSPKRNENMVTHNHWQVTKQGTSHCLTILTSNLVKDI